jgi:hypothetical protein
VCDVQVTPQRVHHPRHHENGQKLAGNVGKPDKFLIVRAHHEGRGTDRYFGGLLVYQAPTLVVSQGSQRRVMLVIGICLRTGLAC